MDEKDLSEYKETLYELMDILEKMGDHTDIARDIITDLLTELDELVD